MDRISLALCCGKGLFPTVDDVMARPGEGAGVMKLEMVGDSWMTAEPWPFDREEIATEMPARRVRGGAFGSVEEFREAYGKARVEGVRLVVRRSPSSRAQRGMDREVT
jgi:hypothetical protein